MFRRATLSGTLAMLLCASAAYAFPPIDLTAPGAASYGNDGTYWQNLNPNQTTQPAGTGIYDPFLRLQANGNGPTGDNGIQEGLNTDGTVSEPYDNVGNDPHTHSVLLGSLSTFTRDFGAGSNTYYLFTLDINEPAGGGQSFLSIDKIQIYTVGNAAGGSLTSLASIVGAGGILRYNLDGIADQTVFLDYNNSNTQKNQGSGVDDMALWIPTSFFAGASATDYMYFYTMMGSAGSVGGESWFGEDGFEEWRVDTGAPPASEPVAVVLFGFGLLGIAGLRRWKK